LHKLTDSSNIVNDELVLGFRNGLLLTDMRLDGTLVHGCILCGIPSVLVTVPGVRESFAQESTGELWDYRSSSDQQPTLTLI